MIIGTLAVLAFLFSHGGGGLDFYLTNVKDSVKDAVKDKQRREVVLDASKALSKDMEALEKDIQKQFQAYVEAHENYNAKPAEFDAITARLVADQKQLTKLVLDARDKMHEQMTADEWSVVFKRK